MSAIQQMLATTRSPITVSGNLTNSGSLDIPVGATSISLSGRGGTAIANYNGGQAYIAPYDVYSYAWVFSYWSNAAPDSAYAPYTVISNNSYYTGSPGGAPTGSGQTTTYYWSSFNTSSGEYTNGISHYTTQSTFLYTNPGQPYIAPYYTYTNGAATTATLNGTTRTWAGGSGGSGATGNLGTANVQELTSTGGGQSMTYSVGSGGMLYYSYTY